MPSSAWKNNGQRAARGGGRGGSVGGDRILHHQPRRPCRGSAVRQCYGVGGRCPRCDVAFFVVLRQREFALFPYTTLFRSGVVGRVGVRDRAAVDRRRIGEGGPWIVGRDGEGQAEGRRGARGQRRTRRTREHAGGQRAARVGGRGGRVGGDRILHHHPRRHCRGSAVRQGDGVGGRCPRGDAAHPVALGQREVGRSLDSDRDGGHVGVGRAIVGLVCETVRAAVVAGWR